MASTAPKAPEDIAVAIAVLYERMDAVINQLKSLESKLDDQSAHRDLTMTRLEIRVQELETSLLKARWFIVGVAGGGGMLGGGMASLFTAMWG